MPINKNHEFEDLDGVKCSIVERNASKVRVEFLKSLLAYNGYEVIIVDSPPPKVAPVPKPITVTASTNPEVSITQPASDLAAMTPLPVPSPPTPTAPETFTIGVTDVMFNPTNAVFGRLLHTDDGHVVTLAYWEQKEAVSHDEIPYFENDK